MRLIDADALMEQYGLKDATKYGNKDSEQQAHSYSTLMLYEIADMIEDAPTAYDVEKVMEKLESVGDLHEKLSRSEELISREKYIHKLLHGLCVKVINIVRAGGKE